VPNAHESLLDLLLEQGRYDLLQAELAPFRSRAASGDLAAHRIVVKEIQKLDRETGGWPSADLRAACEAAVEDGCEDLRETLADILAAVGADETAIREYRRVLDLNPDAGHVRLRMIGLLVRLNRIEEARNLASAAPEGDRQGMIWDLAQELLRAGLVEQAVSLIHSALDNDELPDPVYGGLAGKLAEVEGGADILAVLAPEASVQLSTPSTASPRRTQRTTNWNAGTMKTRGKSARDASPRQAGRANYATLPIEATTSRACIWRACSQNKAG
jgi:tetratricopeptide (TPR) repeat protein